MTSKEAIETLASAPKWDRESKDAIRMAIEALKREQQFLDAGYKNRQVEFYIGGRKFMVKELAQ